MNFFFIYFHKSRNFLYLEICKIYFPYYLKLFIGDRNFYKFYSIKWINLSDGSIQLQSDTTFLNSYSNLLLSSPKTVVSTNWLSIIQKTH